MDASVEKILDYYRDKYEVNYNVEAFGIEAPYFAKRSDRQEKGILGFKTGGNPVYGPEAAEYVFILRYDTVTNETANKIKTLLIEAEKEYVTPGPDHGFTFLSAIVVAAEIDGEAANTVKKFKLSRNYGKHGFTVSRIAVLTMSEDIICNKDGKELKNLIIKQLKNIHN